MASSISEKTAAPEANENIIFSPGVVFSILKNKRTNDPNPHIEIKNKTIRAVTKILLIKTLTLSPCVL
jgi:hypothetical protein